MSYTIKLTNGTVFAVVPDGTINTTSSMTLIGKNYAGYGQFLDDNFIHLLESGSNDSPPASPIIGQLWWDSANKVLKIYTGTNFKSLASNIASATPPPNPVTGDMWFNTSNDSLSVYSGSTWVTIGPSVVNGTGTIPAVIEDTFGINHNVVEILIGSTIVGIVSKDPVFTPLIAIPGFISVGPGYNVASSIAGVNQFFQGTATNSLALNGLASSAFMSAVQNTGTTGTIGITNDGGLITGAQQNFSFYNNVNDGIIQNATSGGNIIIRLNVGGQPTSVARFNGANGDATFSGNITTTANIQGQFILGNGSMLTGIGGGSSYGNANVAAYLPTYNGQIGAANTFTGFGTMPSGTWGNGFSGIAAGSSNGPVTSFVNYNNPSNPNSRWSILSTNYVATSGSAAQRLTAGPAIALSMGGPGTAGQDGGYYFFTANTGAAGSAITWNNPMVVSGEFVYVGQQNANPYNPTNPPPWGPGFSGLVVGTNSYVLDYDNPANTNAKLSYFATNYYATSATSAVYDSNGPASSVAQVNGDVLLLTADAGVAGNPITWRSPIIAQENGYAQFVGATGQPQIAQFYSGTTLMAFVSNGGVFNTVSDTNVKDDQQVLSYGLDHLANLVPKSFTYTTDSTSQTHFGLIAQEVESIIPEIVSEVTYTLADPNDPFGTGTTDTKKSVAYQELIPVIINAIQEIKARLDAAGI